AGSRAGHSSTLAVVAPTRHAHAAAPIQRCEATTHHEPSVPAAASPANSSTAYSASPVAASAGAGPPEPERRTSHVAATTIGVTIAAASQWPPSARIELAAAGVTPFDDAVAPMPMRTTASTPSAATAMAAEGSTGETEPRPSVRVSHGREGMAAWRLDVGAERAATVRPTSPP